MHLNSRRNVRKASRHSIDLDVEGDSAFDSGHFTSAQIPSREPGFDDVAQSCALSSLHSTKQFESQEVLTSTAIHSAYENQIPSSYHDPYGDSSSQACMEDEAYQAAITSILNSDTRPMYPRVFSVQMVHELYRLCLLTKPDDSSEYANPEIWEPVRTYLVSDCELVQTAAWIRSEAGLTPFHQICRHSPPKDVVELFIECVGIDVVRTPDHAGMLPIHYACIHHTSVDVVDMLVILHPESLVIQDQKGATPLHYAVTNLRCSSEVIARVCHKDAAATVDANGMLPIHHSTLIKAYMRPETVKVLIQSFPEGLSIPDRRGRVPVRWLAKTCDRTETLVLLISVISLDPSLAKGDMGLSLLAILGECARNVSKSDNIQSFLNVLLEYNPDPSERYLAVLKTLPSWLHVERVSWKSSKLGRFVFMKRMFQRRKKRPSEQDN